MIGTSGTPPRLIHCNYFCLMSAIRRERERDFGPRDVGRHGMKREWRERYILAPQIYFPFSLPRCGWKNVMINHPQIRDRGLGPHDKEVDKDYFRSMPPMHRGPSPKRRKRDELDAPLGTLPTVFCGTACSF